MISKQDIIRVAKEFVRHQQGKQVKRLIHPRREWALGVIIFALIVISGAGVGWWQYDRNQADNIEVTVSAVNRIPAYNTEAATQLIETFAERRIRYSLLQSAAERSAVLPVTSPATTTKPAAEVANVETETSTPDEEVDAPTDSAEEVEAVESAQPEDGTEETVEEVE